MPLVKNNFLKGKMNKDVDPRLVGEGEYLDARNVSILNSTTGNSGSVENVHGNVELSDFGLTDRHLEIIGVFVDEANDRIFAFVTNYSDSSVDKLSNFAPIKSKHYICVYDLKNNTNSILVGGNFLNFSKTHEILSVNLLEDFLFFTDNRNQPRKINAKKALIAPFGSINPYYTREENISVAKYYPWKPIDLYRNSLTGELSIYDSELVGAITQNVDDATNGSLAISIPDAGGVSRTGVGVGAEAVIVVESNEVVSIKINVSGSGFEVGDTVTVSSSGLGSTDDLIFQIRECDIKKESTLKDTKFEFLPSTVRTTVKSTVSGSLTYTINEPTAPTDVNKMYGCKVIAKDTEGNYVIEHEQNVTVVSVSAAIVTLSEQVDLNAGDVVIMGANPYYIADNKSDDVLTEQFVRFSYRYIYEDNEASLIAPFTQHAFIPKQDGHFLGVDPATDGSLEEKEIDKDEQESISSTIVSFFENKVTEAGLVISAPEGIDGFKNLGKELKVKSIEILYKSSKDQSIKVIDSLSVDDFVGVDENKYEYVYKSEKPIRALPQKDVTRVYDTVPIRAKAQEVIGNRVIYGNILVKSTSPSELNYSISVGDKPSQSSDYGTLSKIEYQSSTVKQNRTYQVGIVLVDKFGRQSDVILSKNSSVFNKFKSPNDALVSEKDIYAGDSLKIALNDVIPESYSKPGYVGLYSEESPLGWYSYKIVVKQQEQSYYNLYVPTLLNGYPHAANDHENHEPHSDLAHITLFGDNINKAPRDLNKISGQDKVFSSSVELVSRVDNNIYDNTAHTSFQNSSNRTYDEITLIGERNEIGLAKTESGKVYASSPFFGIPGVPKAGEDINDSRGSNPLIGRMSTNSILGTSGGHGLTSLYNGDEDEISFERLRLNILETKPLESALDIFWETTTAGLISELNEDVSNSAPEGAVAVSVQSLGFRLTEASNVDDIVSAYFSPLDASRNPIIGDDVQMSIISVKGGGGSGSDFTDAFEIVKEPNNKFRLKNKIKWVYVDGSDINYRFKFTFLVSNTIDAELYTSRVSTSEPNTLLNLSPFIPGETTNEMNELKFIQNDNKQVLVRTSFDEIQGEFVADFSSYHSYFTTFDGTKRKKRPSFNKIYFDLDRDYSKYDIPLRIGKIQVSNGSTKDWPFNGSEINIKATKVEFYHSKLNRWREWEESYGGGVPDPSSLIKIEKYTNEVNNNLRYDVYGVFSAIKLCALDTFNSDQWKGTRSFRILNQSEDVIRHINMPTIQKDTSYRVTFRVSDANYNGASRDYIFYFIMRPAAFYIPRL